MRQEPGHKIPKNRNSNSDHKVPPPNPNLRQSNGSLTKAAHNYSSSKDTFQYSTNNDESLIGIGQPYNRELFVSREDCWYRDPRDSLEKTDGQRISKLVSTERTKGDQSLVDGEESLVFKDIERGLKESQGSGGGGGTGQ